MGLHELVVLASVCSYALPLYEALARRSRFYTAVFGCVLLLSGATHCDETGVCAPLSSGARGTLAVLSSGMSVYLAGLMLLVVLEVRNEGVPRALLALWAAGAALRDASDVATNGAVTLALGLLFLAADVSMFKRRFTPAWWRRLGLILAMAALGGALFKAVHTLYVWHGIWHVYFAGCCYLLLLAQRTKRTLAARGGAKAAGGAHGAAAHVGAAQHGLTTPIKRRSSSGGGGGGSGGEAHDVAANVGHEDAHAV